MMSSDYVSSISAQATHFNLAAMHAMVTLTLKAPVNHPDIVTINDTGFRVNMNKMKPGKFYMVEFMDDRYLIWKNRDDALVMTEVP